MLVVNSQNVHHFLGIEQTRQLGWAPCVWGLGTHKLLAFIGLSLGPWLVVALDIALLL